MPASVLPRFGCDVAQGYHLGRPMPAHDFERWLTDSPFGRDLLVAAA
jgi:EAL domain-containing protein (putative c-di-GMP-specific phosphodiesterase class I)